MRKELCALRTVHNANIEIVRVECMDIDLRIYIVYMHKTVRKQRKKNEARTKCCRSGICSTTKSSDRNFILFATNSEQIELLSNIYCFIGICRTIFFFPPHEKSRTKLNDMELNDGLLHKSKNRNGEEADEK